MTNRTTLSEGEPLTNREIERSMKRRHTSIARGINNALPILYTMVDIFLPMPFALDGFIESGLSTKASLFPYKGSALTATLCY